MTEQTCATCAKIGNRCYRPPNSMCKFYEPAKKIPLMWNVYTYNINKGEIEAENIFDHWKFNEDVQIDLRSCKTKSSFTERLRQNLQYYFWSKCEHEIVISSWPHKESTEMKIDVYQQVMLNWDIFSDYVWSKRGVT